MIVKTPGSRRVAALAKWAALMALAAATSGMSGCSDNESSGDVALLDQDRDGVLASNDCDDDDPEVGAPRVWFADTDGDQLGDPQTTLRSCERPEGYVASSGDAEPACATNDTDACGVCGGPGGQRWYPDVDGDGAGDSALGVERCTPPEGWVAEGGDPDPTCATDDTDACGVCGGPGPVMAWVDVDGDGLGDPRSGLEVCALPPGFADNDDDPEPECATNDTDDCGVCGGPGVVTRYPDTDGDGLGDGSLPLEACTNLGGLADNGDDPEPGCATNDTDTCGVCGGQDAAKDCLGVCFGEAVVDACGDCGGDGPAVLYQDVDGDGLGDPATLQEVCGDRAGFVDNGDDPEPACRTNDTDACGVCGGPGARFYYGDADMDGLGDPNVASERRCDAPEGYVDNSRDAEPECATNDTDFCGVCGGGNADMDCIGVCQGEAFLDTCGRCVGGTTGREPAVEDLDGNGTPDLCEACLPGRRAIIQWTGIAPFGQQRQDRYTFQLILDEDGTITIQYGDVEPYQLSATVGIQAPNGAAAVEVAENTPFPTEHALIQLTPNPGEPLDRRYTADYFLPPYWLDIRDVGQALSLGDDEYMAVDLGFDFPFYDEVVSQVLVHANGLVGINLAGGQHYQNTGLPNGQLGSFIAPLWDDLNPANGGTIHVWTQEATCERDCNDVIGGLARPAECGGCVTGPEFGEIQDCNGTCGGTAYLDGCGRCVAGTTGLDPMNPDCSGECGGEAYRDVCGICVGGTTGAEPSDPEACPAGVDLIVDETYLQQTVRLDHVNVPENDCLIQERCVRGSGDRKVIRFGTRIANIGTEDLALGVPGPENPNWNYDACHSHYHFASYAAYDIVDVERAEQLDIGSKNGFCVLDIGVYDPALAPNGCNGYTCGNQGISAGCQDTYSSSLQCQWIDVTGLRDGVYDIIVTTNPDGVLAERDVNNNSARVRVRMTGETVEVIEE